MVRLEKLGTLAAVSSFYETEPVEFTAQPWFLNCVVALDTEKPRRNFCALCSIWRQEMGRQRTHSKGPRVIDLDILLYGDVILREPGLTIPHPGLPERRFVLEPLAEIAGDLIHPGLRKPARSPNSGRPTAEIHERAGRAARLRVERSEFRRTAERPESDDRFNRQIPLIPTLKILSFRPKGESALRRQRHPPTGQ